MTRPGRRSGRLEPLALESNPIERIQGAVAEALARVFGVFDALAIVAVIVAALGIVNTLTMGVVERIREIGVLRAIGMSRRQAMRMVVVEAAILGIVGVVLGSISGLAAGAVLLQLGGGFDEPGGLPGSRSASRRSSASSCRRSRRSTRLARRPDLDRPLAPFRLNADRRLLDSPRLRAAAQSLVLGHVSTWPGGRRDDDQHAAHRPASRPGARPDHRRFPGPDPRLRADLHASAHAALILIGTLLITLTRPGLHPDPARAIHGQTFGVLLSAGALGFRRGVAASALYLLLGAIGLPVFAEGKHGIE